MASLKALFDTNILIDYLNGIPAARDEIARYDAPLISPITWMEVMVGAKSDNDDTQIRTFLSRFTQTPVNEKIAELAVMIRRDSRIRLPDAIIRASAQYESALLVTRNTKDFPPDSPDIRVPYHL